MVIFTIPIAIINTVIIWYALYYGSLIDFDVMNTILNSNFQESKEFLIYVFDYKIIISILLFFLPFILIYFMQPFKIKNKIVIIILVLSVVIITALIYGKRWVIREIAITKIYNTYIVTKEHKKEFLKILYEADKTAIQFDNITSNLNENNKQTFVLVISESQNRHHFSIYGYDKQTTPFLDTKSNDIFIFTDIDSPHILTNNSVEKIITFSDNYNNLKGYEAGDLIKFFKNAGFKTFWLSNQYFLGPHESQYSAIAYRADESIFLNKMTGLFLETINNDGALIPVFEKALQDNSSKKFIVLHLMGSHAPYEIRYPKNFGSFNYNLGLKDLTGGISKQKEIATYDNSIEYTDYLLQQIIHLLEKENVESYLLFLSDHGIDVYDTYPDRMLPRNVTSITPALVEIPFFIWFSDKYKDSYQDVIKRVSSALDRPYQADRLPHTIIDLSRLNHDIYIDNDSIISDNYTTRDRIVGEKSLDNGWEFRQNK